MAVRCTQWVCFASFFRVVIPVARVGMMSLHTFLISDTQIYMKKKLTWQSIKLLNNTENRKNNLIINFYFAF